MWIYLNDKLVSEAEAKVSVFDHGFLYGDGLFETFRAYSGRIFAESVHLERLAASAKRIQLMLPPAPLLAKRLEDTLQRNHLVNAILRLTLTRGEARSGFSPRQCVKATCVITARPLGNYGELYKTGASATLSAIQRVASLAGAPCMKSLNFLDNILARLEAERDAVFETLFLNSEGQLAEGAISNLFWIKKGRIHTPALTTPILNGVTRQLLIAELKKTGTQVEEGRYPLETLLKADEAFLTNTAFEVMPLTRLKENKIGSGQPGPVTHHCHRLFQSLVKAMET